MVFLVWIRQRDRVGRWRAIHALHAQACPAAIGYPIDIIGCVFAVNRFSIKEDGFTGMTFMAISSPR